jgi:hypothetical protein
VLHDDGAAMTAAGSKCRVCKEPAVIDLPRHNAHFCAEHLQQLCRRQMAKAIEEFDMFTTDDQILVAVSGGKDSLAVWDIEAGYDADGLYIGLGIGEYSTDSGGYVRRFADARGLTLREIDLRADYGYDVPTASRATGRVPCSACGLSKRRLFDQAALDGGYDVVVTGHNLDDEAAVLFVARDERLPEEGQTAGASHRTRDGGVVSRPRHRLRRGGVSDRRRQQASVVQGVAECDRVEVPRSEGRVLSRLPRTHGATPGRTFGCGGG